MHTVASFPPSGNSFSSCILTSLACCNLCFSRPTHCSGPSSGSKVVPGFGIHPWWSHLHASSQGDSWQQLLEAPSQQQLQAALDILSTTDPVTNSGAYETNRPHAPDHTSNHATTSSSSNSSDGSFTGIQASISQGSSEQQRRCLGEGLRVVPQEEWQGRLRQLLTDLPGAIVGGECASLVLAGNFHQTTRQSTCLACAAAAVSC